MTSLCPVRRQFRRWRETGTGKTPADDQGGGLGSAGESGEPAGTHTPGPVRVLIAVVLTAYCAAVVAAAVLAPPRAGQLPLALMLVAGSGVIVEVTRRLREPDCGVIRDVYAIFDLPCAVLLTPLWALVVPLPRAAWTQLRVRQGPDGRRGRLHRRAYSAAATGLGYALVSVVFHGSVHALGPGFAAGTGGKAVCWALLACGCGMLRAAGDVLVLVAIKGSLPRTRTRMLAELIGPEAARANGAELALGTLAALAASWSWMLVALTAPLVWVMQVSVRHPDLLRRATTDSKTALLNDEAWRDAAAAEVRRARQDRAPLAVMIMDIDHFKLVNDVHGHLAGDSVLAAVAATARAAARSGDLAGRIGGEEFGFVLPRTSAAEAAEVAQRLRMMVPRTVIPPPAPGVSVPSRVTVSIGIAAGWHPGWDLNSYLARADAALYCAKRHGRDEVWMDTGPEPRPVPELSGVPSGQGPVIPVSG